ncbi:MAG TPA: hypothetical protein VES67_05510 [Vicinamibacterales bacterium]|nr:hypothetical protein [Vicinamibacterales bacterium]
MTSHLGVMILFAACVSLVFGTLLRETPREELRLASRIFIGMVGGAYLVGWIMFLMF